jgi:tetratricopeptide (TPR) repeat protein
LAIRYRFLIESEIDAGLRPSDRPAKDTASADGPSEGAVIAALRRAAEESPAEPDYHYLLGLALARQGRPQEALASLEEAIRLAPADVAGHLALGDALRRLGRTDEAVGALREALRLRPEDARVLNALGALLGETGAAEEAVATFTRALAVSPTRAEVHANQAAALRQLGKPKEAARALRRAIRIDPKAADLHRDHGLALAEAGEHEASFEALRRAVRIRPEDASLHADLADALLARGRSAEAAAAYEAALARDPGCLQTRPASQQARHALALAALRTELAAERDDGRVGRSLWKMGFAARRGVLWLLRRHYGLDALVVAVLCAAAFHAGSAVLRPYVRYYAFRDDVVQIARQPTLDDGEIQERLRFAVEKAGLSAALPDGRCVVRSDVPRRQILCDYVEVLELGPGVAPSLRFRIDVVEPFFPAREPVQIQ